MSVIGSTVEGVSATHAALAVAERAAIPLPIARAVADAISYNTAQTVWLSALSDLLEETERESS